MLLQKSGVCFCANCYLNELDELALDYIFLEPHRPMVLIHDRHGVHRCDDLFESRGWKRQMRLLSLWEKLRDCLYDPWRQYVVNHEVSSR